MHTQVDPSGSGKVHKKEAGEFLARSNLPKNILIDIWNLASFNGDYLDRDEFYVTLRLVSYAQNDTDNLNKI